MLATKKQIDMLNGPLLSKLLCFSLPIMASGILQLLYNAADIIVVGRYAGSDSLAAVGTSSTPTQLYLNICIGIASGVGIVVAQSYGAKNSERVSKAVHTAVVLSVIMGTVIGVIGILTCRGLLKLIAVPSEIFDKAHTYVFIYLLGIPANMLYNCCASVVRATGDTKRPLYILIVSGLVNVFLNIILVRFFNLDVAGVAIATVVSQVISAVLIIIVLLKSDDIIRLKISKLKLDFPTVGKIFSIGIPAGIQSSLFTISNLTITSGVNSFGTTVMAGSAAASNIEGFVYVSMNSIHQAAMTFAGQNYGAKKFKRISKVYVDCIFIVTVIGVVMGLAVYLLSHPLLSIYNTDPEVIAAGAIKLKYICLPYVICGLMEVTNGVLRGVGKPLGPTVITLLGVCALRVVWVNTIFKVVGTVSSLYISYPITWSITFIALLIYLVITIKQINKKGS